MTDEFQEIFDKHKPLVPEIIKLEPDSDIFKMVSVGCWGVYCDDGVYQKKEKRGKTKQKDTYIIRKQKTVFTNMNKFIDEQKIKTVFLCGDNIYKTAKPINGSDSIEFYGKSDIEKQLETLTEGKSDCSLLPNVQYYGLLGNHDIESCEILKTQLSSGLPLKIPALYYDVLIKLETSFIHIIVLDTNAFEQKPTDCTGKLNSEYSSTQYKWAVERYKKVQTDYKDKKIWCVMIGHVPYVANWHKDKQNNTDRKILTELVGEIKPHLYICADEHNQQCIYDKNNKTTIVIAGSGGTDLDEITKCVNDSIYQTRFFSLSFGFVSYKFDTDNTRVVFHDKDGCPNYRINVPIDRNIEEVIYDNSESDAKLKFIKIPNISQFTKLATNVTGKLSDFSEQTKTFAKNINNLSNQASNKLNTVSKQVDSLSNEAAKKLNTFSKQVDSLSDQASEKINTLSSQVNDISGQVNNLSKQTVNKINTLSDTVSTFKFLSSGLTDIIKNASSITKNLDTLSKKASTMVKNTPEPFNNAFKLAKNTVDRFKTTGTRELTNLSNNANAFAKEINDLSGQASTLVQNYQNPVGNPFRFIGLGDFAKNASKITGKFTSIADKASKSIKQASSSLSDATDKISKSATSVSNTASDFSNKLNTASKSAESLITKATVSASDLSNKLNIAASGLAKNVNFASDLMNNTTSQLSDHINTTSGMLSGITDSISSLKFKHRTKIGHTKRSKSVKSLRTKQSKKLSLSKKNKRSKSPKKNKRSKSPRKNKRSKSPRKNKRSKSPRKNKRSKSPKKNKHSGRLKRSKKDPKNKKRI